jgi:hypothetical protein
MSHSMRSSLKAVAAVAVAAGFALAAGQASASCNSFVQPLVDWSKKKDSDGSHDYPVYVTIAKHFAADGKLAGMSGQKGDPVFIGFGEASTQAAKQPGQLAGLALTMRVPNTDWQISPKVTADFTINTSGIVTYVEKINGKPIGGMAPAQFTGNCQNGLITGMVGSTAWTISMYDGASLPVLK